jgi:hypothetical protein
VNQSADGGKTWDDPISAIAKDGFTYLLGKPWSTIDPTQSKENLCLLHRLRTQLLQSLLRQ